MGRLSNQSDSAAAAKKKNAFLASNPVMRRLNKVDEYAETDSATYGGIALKTVFFLLFCAAGMILSAILKPLLQSGSDLSIDIKGFVVKLTSTEALVLGGVVLAAVGLQLLAFFVKATTPVAGALYCVTQGYFISFLIFTVLPENYRYLGLLALAMTLIIVLAMAVLYATGIIRVNKKFKMVMLSLFVTSVGSSLLMLAGYFIPFTREWVVQMSHNLVLTIIIGVVFIIIAALFLICDFDTIDHVVNDKLPKKYEWQAAFGLAFTVLWIYLKVLDLLLTIAGSKKK